LAVAPLDFSEPVDTTAFYKNVLRPALAAVGLPASTPERVRDNGKVVPAVEGVPLHDYADLCVMPTFGERCCRAG
jgi:integrase